MTNKMVSLRVDGSVTVPGDKSISHRALMLAALSSGECRLTGLLASADVAATARALSACGAELAANGEATMVRGVGRRGLRPAPGDIDCANSGTTARLISGILAAHPFSSRLTGDASLSRRPMQRIVRPLTAMGATLESERGDGLPLRITGGALHGIDWMSDAASAQVKSAVLLAGYCAGVPVSVTEPVQSRDHTERMLRAAGGTVSADGTTVRFTPGAPLRAFSLAVPADPSSAAFWMALAALADAGTLRLPNVCLNPTRTGFLALVRRMGARIDREDERETGAEPVGTLVCHPSALRGITVEPSEVPSAIDELPVVAVLAARAAGETRVAGAGELRVKESDRIAAVVSNLRALGADADDTPDGFVIRGSDRPLRGTVHTHGDHRIAMAFGILGALPGNDITVDDRDCVAVSYPGFWEDLHRVIR